MNDFIAPIRSLTTDDAADHAEMLQELIDWRHTHCFAHQHCAFLALAKMAFWESRQLGWNNQQLRQVVSSLIAHWTKEESKKP